MTHRTISLIIKKIIQIGTVRICVLYEVRAVFSEDKKEFRRLERERERATRDDREFNTGYSAQ